jgi:uncharacterized membrane protein YhaH (DUF805 family)
MRLALFAPMGLAAPTICRRLHDVGYGAIWIFLAGTALQVLVAAIVIAGFPEAENPVLVTGSAPGCFTSEWQQERLAKTPLAQL